MPTHPIVAISGSRRPGNYTSHALAITVDELRQRGHNVEVIDARALTLNFPGEPTTEDARRVRTSVQAAHGVVLATPEYHGTFSSIMKLIIENLGFPSALAEKPVALVGVASGRIGAIKSLEHLKSVMAHVGALVAPGGVSVAGVQGAFDATTGACTNAATEEALRGVASSLLTFMQSYVCPKYILERQVREHAGAPEVMPA